MAFQAKAVILDMDGTMLDHENRVSQTLTDIIKTIRQNGRKVFIATGRTIKEAKDATPHDLEVDGIVCANGMVVYMDGKQIVKHSLDSNLVTELVGQAQKEKIYYEVHPIEGSGAALIRDKAFFMEEIQDPKPESVKEDEWLSRKAAIAEDIEWTDNLPTEDAAKIYFFSKDKQRMTAWKQTLDQLKEKHDFSAFASSDHNVEVMQKNVSKATGIQYLLEHYALTNEDIMMIGDSENDLPLMEIAGYAVAMKNAADVVKQQVDEITAYSHKEDGLYHFLYEKFSD
ncbi:Cof-type HAD-IIB family hydrolase [Virgibacillus senegalensis]|uniref:Cof-type HAD-IIB family hydrolase n=1 Tax=Virgibacillus senegalensis TaxID=1499679 RepID=UPI00069CC92E|nr:Cof-type HAD-IIB family hydrolase [Virgibacillus senegalensis]